MTQLYESLVDEPGVEVLTFSWRRALLGSWQVLHVHWPETLYGGRTAMRRRLNEVRYLLLLLRVRVGHRVLVRTAHNPAPHECPGVIARGLELLTSRWTGLTIRLNEHTIVPRGAVVTVPHGHYRHWFACHVGLAATPRPGRVLYFGLVRGYKGIEALLDLLETNPDEEVELRIVGAPVDAALAERVRAAAARDPRLTCDLRYVEDRSLAREIAAARLVVLPYRAMHNSGALLLALSLDRPVLAPANEVTDDLAREVGERWLIRYADPLAMSDVTGGLVAAAGLHGRPCLDARGWASSGRAHADAYRRAVSAVAAGIPKSG